MNPLKYLIIHCSATTQEQNTTFDDIIRMHTSPKSQGGRGWRRVGYGVFIEKDRVAYAYHDNGNGIVDEYEMTNGVKGLNGVSKHICYAGGVELINNKLVPMDTRTPFQIHAMKEEIDKVLAYAPDVLIAGHNQFNNKACPSFWVPDFLKQIGIPDKNIYKNDPFGYRRFLKTTI